METQATSSATTTSTGLRYGLLTGLVSILISFVVNALQMEASPLRYLSWVVLVVGIILAQRDFKQHRAGFISYGEGLGIGMTVAVVFGALSAVFTYIYTSFIDPEAITRAMDKARTDMEARGNLSDAQIDQAVALSAKFTSGPVLLVVVVIVSVLTGLVISLVSSAIIKNPKPEFE